MSQRKAREACASDSYFIPFFQRRRETQAYVVGNPAAVGLAELGAQDAFDFAAECGRSSAGRADV